MSKKEQLEEARSEVESMSADDIVAALEAAHNAKSRPKLTSTLQDLIDRLETLQNEAQEALDARQEEVENLQEVVNSCETLRDAAQSVIDNLEE